MKTKYEYEGVLDKTIHLREHPKNTAAISRSYGAS